MPAEATLSPEDVPPVRLRGVPQRPTAVRWFAATDPEGGVHKLHERNRRDWENRGKGWAIRGPWLDASAPAPAPAADVPPPNAPDAPVIGEAVSREHSPAVLAPLESLRAELRALGVEPKDNWGLRRLNQEIAAAKGAQ